MATTSNRSIDKPVLLLATRNRQCFEKEKEGKDKMKRTLINKRLSSITGKE
jgi:hypothetical protein